MLFQKKGCAVPSEACLASEGGLREISSPKNSVMRAEFAGRGFG